MTGYGDPELLVGDWLKGVLGVQRKVWKDPNLPADWDFNAPLVHIQRGQGLGQVPLSLDDVTLDVNVYAKVADHARTVAQTVWSAMILQLPLTSLGSILVKGSWVLSPPTWAPDPSVYRRSAAYRVMLHGFVE